jgi:putative ABC transport system substrate-binding protein
MTVRCAQLVAALFAFAAALTIQLSIAPAAEPAPVAKFTAAGPLTEAERKAILAELQPLQDRLAAMRTAPNVNLDRWADAQIFVKGVVWALDFGPVADAASRELVHKGLRRARERIDALFVAADSFFTSRGVQFATLAASNRIPAAYGNRDMVAVGGLMSYGTDRADRFRQVGVYAGNILKGAKPADLPVQQSTKFEFVINLQTARALGIEVPNSIQLLADEVIE